MKYSIRQISIVIPNWNGVELLKQNLPGVLSESKGVGEVIVVDDGSTDSSVALLHKHFPQVRVIKKANHEGFSSAVNEGVLKATGEIILLLNTDIQPEKNFLSPLLDHFDDPLVFAVGCMDKSMEDGQVVLRGRGEAAWIKGFYVHWRGDIRGSETAWVSCGSGAFRKSVWLKLNGLDPLYNPFYWEDIDISYRASKKGYKLLFEPKSIVTHYHEEGKIREQYSNRYVNIISYRNQFIFIWKNFSSALILLQHIFWAPVRILQTLLHGDYFILVGFLWALFLTPKILKRRFS